MKVLKHFFILMIVGISNSSVAQTQAGTYHSKYFDKDYAVSTSKADTKGEFSFYIDTETLDATSKEVNLIVKNKQLPEFVAFIDSMKRVFIKWEKTALENNVMELDKEIEYRRTPYAAGFNYGSWQFDFAVSLTPRFKFIKDKPVLIISSGKLQSSSNQFIDNDGLYIVFSNATEFTDFIKALDVSVVIEKQVEDKKKAELFTN